MNAWLIAFFIFTDQNQKRQLSEVEMKAFRQALIDNQNRNFEKGFDQPHHFSSDAYASRVA